MRRSGNPALSLMLPLPLTAISVFAVLLIFSLIRMVEIQNVMRVEAEQNMLWVFHQSEIASLRLSETAALADLGEAGKGDLELRFDILASQIALLEAGPQRRFVKIIGFDDDLARLVLALDDVAPIIEGFAIGDGLRLRRVLEPFVSGFGRAANMAMIEEWDSLGGRLELYRGQMHQTIQSLIGIMLAGGILATMLVMALRESRRRNALLRRERDFSGLLIASSGEGILAVDKEGRCTLWNSAMTGMVARSEQQAVGRPLAEVAGFFDTSAVRQSIARALDGVTSQLTLQPVFREGREEARYVDLRFYPMRNDEQIVGAIAFMQDVSDHHAAQQKEAEDRDQLEHLVTERTRDLNNALRREKSAADLYRNFAAMVSHQFRTPLAVADSAMQRLVRRGPHAEADEVVERAGRARKAIAGLTRLVESTLDAARLDAGRMGARCVECDIGEIAQVVCSRQRDAAPDRQILLRQTKPGKQAVFCDSAHVEQILENLLSNAVKYAHPETQVLVSLYSNDASYSCEIHNEGGPVPDEDRARIFERNQRGTNSDGVTGTGVGLFMARTLARMQGGDVVLVSEGDGVTFRLDLPRFDVAAT